MNYTATLNVQMENGESTIIYRDVEAFDKADAEKTILDAWVKHLYVETDLYKIVKCSEITAMQKMVTA